MKKVVLSLMALCWMAFALLIIVTPMQKREERPARMEGVAPPSAVSLSKVVSSQEIIPRNIIPQRKPTEIIPKVININTASLKALKTLPHIGPKIAERIIKYRQAYGPFQSLEEITKVAGIGPKTLEKIKGRITVGTIPTHIGIPNTSLQAREETATDKGKTIPCPEGVGPIERVGSIMAEGDIVSNKEKVNINTATLEGLASLPRIGPKIAERIMAYRNNYGRFKSIEEIMKVKGIGPKTFEKIKEMITVDKDG